MWIVLACICAAYVFLGVPVIGIATTMGSWILISLSVLAYVLAWVLLGYARKQPW
jgi:hypothetical protein